MLMLTLAFRNLLRNRRRTALTLLSMVGGYLLVALMNSLEGGSYDQVLSFYTRDVTGHVQITAPGFIERPSLYRTVPATPAWLRHLSEHPGVSEVTARIENSALAYGEEKSFPVQVTGVLPQAEAALSRLNTKVTTGAYFSPEPDTDGVYSALIGHTVARQLSLGVNDELVLISQGADGSLANDLYRIVGIVGDADSPSARQVYLPLVAAQSFYVLPEQAHRLVVLGRDYRQARALADRLHEGITTEPSLAAAGAAVAPWQAVARDFYETMEADREGSRFASYVLILLVAVGVLNTVLMSVLERTREFGVLKAIGTSPLRLFSLILLETQLLAIIACVLGLLIAFPANLWLSRVGFEMGEAIEVSGILFSHYRGQMSVMVFAFPALVILGASLLVSLLPGLRAARLSPIDAMRAH
ncbi:MAG: ABC transporter permease [Saccharospirillum sp.]